MRNRPRRVANRGGLIRSATFCTGSAAFTLVFAVLGVRFALVAHLLADVLLVAYVGLLARMRAISTERELKLRFLPQGGNGYHDADASSWGDISAAFATAAVQ